MFNMYIKKNLRFRCPMDIFGNYPIKVYSVYKFEMYIEIFIDVIK